MGIPYQDAQKGHDVCTVSGLMITNIQPSVVTGLPIFSANHKQLTIRGVAQTGITAGIRTVGDG